MLDPPKKVDGVALAPTMDSNKANPRNRRTSGRVKERKDVNFVIESDFVSSTTA